MNKLTIFFLILISAFLFPGKAYSNCCNFSTAQYNCNNTNWFLNDAAAALDRCRAGDRNACRQADRLIDRADVAVIQILTECTRGNCLRGDLAPLEGRAERIERLSRDLQNLTGMRRSYANTLGTVRSWRNTKPCVSQNRQNRCQQYANTAVRQHQLNISKSCGYTGSRWSDKYQGHYRWCMNVSENAAHQETEAKKILIDNCAVTGVCNRFIGSWKWFSGFTVQISGDYSFSTSGNNGTWRCLPGGKIEMRWRKGGWIDTLSINPDGNSLSGRNQHGGPVSANRHRVPTPPTASMLYDVQQGSYGGGRFCLTVEEATRVKNDPNTVNFTPVGESCSK